MSKLSQLVKKRLKQKIQDIKEEHKETKAYRQVLKKKVKKARQDQLLKSAVEQTKLRAKMEAKAKFGPPKIKKVGEIKATRKSVLKRKIKKETQPKGDFNDFIFKM